VSRGSIGVALLLALIGRILYRRRAPAAVPLADLARSSPVAVRIVDDDNQRTLQENQRLDMIAATLMQTGIALLLGGLAFAAIIEVDDTEVTRLIIAFSSLVAGSCGAAAGLQLAAPSATEINALRTRRRALTGYLVVLAGSVVGASIATIVIAEF
jgi:hypothetical protein